jgi:hypothetical protein
LFVVRTVRHPSPVIELALLQGRTFRVVEPDVDSNGRSAQSVISSSTLSVIRLIVSLLTEAP